MVKRTVEEEEVGSGDKNDPKRPAASLPKAKQVWLSGRGHRQGTEEQKEQWNATMFQLL